MFDVQLTIYLSKPIILISNSFDISNENLKRNKLIEMLEIFTLIITSDSSSYFRIFNLIKKNNQSKNLILDTHHYFDFANDSVTVLNSNGTDITVKLFTIVIK